MNSIYWPLYEYCELSTVLGVVDLCRAKNIKAKIFWLTVIGVALAVTIWQTFGTFKDYFNDGPFQTSVSVKNLEGIQFPTMTICNFNRVRQSFVDEYRIHRFALYYAFGTAPESYSLTLENFLKFNTTFDDYESAWLEFSARTKIKGTIELFSRFGHSCSMTFLQCQFQMESFDCCSNVIEKISGNGKCFLITPPKSIWSVDKPMQVFPGMNQNIRLRLDR